MVRLVRSTFLSMEAGLRPPDAFVDPTRGQSPVDFQK